MWNSRPNTTDGVTFWAWVDQALVNARKENGTDQVRINRYVDRVVWMILYTHTDANFRYFRKIVDNDTNKWSEALGQLSELSELEDWQRNAQHAAAQVPAK